MGEYDALVCLQKKGVIKFAIVLDLVLECPARIYAPYRFTSGYSGRYFCTTIPTRFDLTKRFESSSGHVAQNENVRMCICIYIAWQSKEHMRRE